MPDIELSVMTHSQQHENALRSLLEEFKHKSGTHVNLTTLRWEMAHTDLNRMALYQHGPDVSQIGSTWVSDLIAMNALRPFSDQELFTIGRPEEFVAEAWKTGHLINDTTQWAIPWLTETYLIHYRRDLLDKAGIDEASAFKTHKQFAKTVRRLGEAGVEVPFEPLLDMDHFGNLHGLASWVWTAGSDFCTPDGKRTQFAQPEAQAAMRAYFELFRIMPPAARQKLRESGGGLFEKGQAAIRFGTLVFAQHRESVPARLKANWACAPLPRQHFIGGSSLVVWKHTRNERSALELVRFLTSAAVSPRIALPMAALPARLAALDTPQIRKDPILSVMADSIRTGRTYNPISLWGLVEDRLMTALLQISKAALAEDEVDLEVLIRQHMEPLARKLNITLSQ